MFRDLDPLTTPGGFAAAETYTVSQLGREVQALLREAWSSVWVVGEIARYRSPGASGHHYFDLVEKGEGDRIVGTLSAVIWRGEWTRIHPVLERAGERLAEGLAVRCRVSLDFYPPGGRLQAQVREIDPAFTLGDLERRRAETLAALEAAGLMEANRGVELAELPLSLGLVSSEGSAAYHDFLATLGESGFGFSVLFVHAAVQGAAAESELVSALELLGGSAVDAIALVRGGGSRTDLVAFDSRAVAEAIARCPRPVLTGLGHEIDVSVADRVAHRAFKTPTKVAEFLVARLVEAENALVRTRDALSRSARLPLGAARERLLAAERRALAARGRLERAGARLSALGAALARSARQRLRGDAARLGETMRRIARSAPRRPERAERDRRVLGWRLAGAARGRLGELAARVEGWSRLASGLSPERTLARGFSITRRGDGVLVRTPLDAPPGARLVTRVAGGSVRSRVEAEDGTESDRAEGEETR
jgi:exodeoxyribonuclease VII large subunit